MNEEDIKIILEEFQRLENVSTAIESNMLLKRKHLENELLKKQNQQLKENIMAMQEEMARTWEKVDLHKKVTEEVREYMNENRTRYIYQDSLGEDWRFDDLDVYSELLQILDKVKE